jgi:hypothetical protein
VDEIDGEQALAGGGIAFDDRFAVEAADQLLVGVESHLTWRP